jgi:hypothetical protein
LKDGELDEESEDHHTRNSRFLGQPVIP